PLWLSIAASFQCAEPLLPHAANTNTVIASFIAAIYSCIGRNMTAVTQLQKTLGPVMIWGLGVGYVISGMYFGWNLGLPEGGPYGLLIATLLVTLMYGAFVFSYAELACAIPKAGGAFDYAHQAFGPRLGFLAGI